MRKYKVGKERSQLNQSICCIQSNSVLFVQKIIFLSCVITFLLLNPGYCEINLSQQSSQVNMMETFIDYNAIYSFFTRHIFKFL